MSSIPGPSQWVKGSGIAAAEAGIQPLVWELPCAAGAAQEIATTTDKKKKKDKKTKQNKTKTSFCHILPAVSHFRKGNNFVALFII